MKIILCDTFSRLQTCPTSKLPLLEKKESYLCNDCHDLMQNTVNFNNVAIVSVKGSDYRILFWYMSKDYPVNIMNSSNLNEKSGLL